MKILEINSCNFGSTGKIMLQIARIARNKDCEVLVCCAKSKSNSKKKINNQLFIGSRISRNVHLQLAYYTGFNGCFSMIATYNFLRKVSRFCPDIIHLHNLHACYINLPMLFRYIKKHNIRVIWTLHDCWAFTGQCPYFTMVKCNKWKTGCFNCPNYQLYPESYVDRTKIMYRLKKKWFTGVNNLTIVTPSQWLADLVKQSFMKNYPIQVINNGIDLSIFKPTDNDFRKQYHCENKYILLGVAFDWGKRKGLDIFVTLATSLPENYQIVLVGTNDDIDKQLPSNIISIHRTESQVELAKIYTAADLFVNPTREENYPTVNMEALACGTPIITFNTGGSPEILDESCGSVVAYDDVSSLAKEIVRICSDRPFSINQCLTRAQSFDMYDASNKYILLYKKQI